MTNREKQEQSAVETVQTDTQSVQGIITNTEIGFEIECSTQAETDGCVVADETITSSDDPKATLSSYQYPTLELLRKADNDSVVIDIEKLQLGSSGLGAGNDPETARREARKQINDIRAMLQDTKVLFLVSCLGGGSGTGVTPIIAREAYNKGIITFVMVTLPFEFEGEHKFRQAFEGIQQMEHLTDGIFFLNNQFLKRKWQDKILNCAFENADLLIQGVIQNLINSTCYD